MITELTDLDLRLTRISEAEFPSSAIPKELKQQIDALRSSLVNGYSASHPPRHRVLDAVQAFRRTRKLRSASDIRLVCFGVVERSVDSPVALVEDLQLFSLLLEKVDVFRAEPRILRRAYKPLLTCYLLWDAPEQGSSLLQNWELLRSFLELRSNELGGGEVAPSWVSALARHRNLLSEDPAGRYASELLNGDWAEFEDAKSGLEIPSGSWLLRSVVLAQVDLAVQQSDSNFLGYLETVLALLETHPLLFDRGLIKLIDRYAHMTQRSVNADLRDKAVRTWGNPWLDSNSSKWGRVTSGARSMVSDWVKLDVIRQFFEVFAEDRGTDKRRFKFWENLHSRIDDIYFALGPSAKYSRSPDVRRLRERMGDRLLSLSHGGSPTNNAFIMQIGGCFVVEFGASGNACFVFRAKDVPFSLRGAVNGDSTGLKHRSCEHRLLHIDRRYRSWEKQFSEVLEILGISSQEPSARDVVSRAEHPISRSVEEGREGVLHALTPESLKTFAIAHGLRVEDRTSAGGSVYVHLQSHHGELVDQLIRWGFRYGAMKQAWYRNGWS